jgi:hypothetical protein
MSFYQFFVDLYGSFLALFPPPIQWLVTLVLVIGIIFAFFSLVRHHWWVLIILILLLPIIVPILRQFFADVWRFFLYLVAILQTTAPS